jgi:PhzF family phenazine biosynthesis protein
MTRPFELIDVFAEAPFTGNPLAVVHAAEGLSTEDMLQITRWLNFSETTFLLPPVDAAADYQVRIVTPAGELPFAGHPTLGSAYSWLKAGGQPKQEGQIIQQCGIGLVTVKQDGAQLAFAAPPTIKSGPLDNALLDEICDVLNIQRADIIDHQWLDNGPGWMGIMLDNAEAVRAVKPKSSWKRRVDIGIVGKVGIIGAEQDAADTQWELRAIFSNHIGSLIEDPVTGSLNASTAQWLYASGRQTGPYVAAQGSCIGRAGRVHISQDADGSVWVGGRCHSLFTGETGF